MQCDFLKTTSSKQSHLSQTKPSSKSRNTSSKDSISADILVHMNILNRLKRNRSTLELINPKVIRQKNNSATELEDKKVQLIEESYSEKKTHEKLENNKQDSDTNHKGKDYKKIRGKQRKKGKDLSNFDKEHLTSKSKLAKTEETTPFNSLSRRKSKHYSQNDIISHEVELNLPEEITVTDAMAIIDLARLLNKTETELIKFLFLQSIPVTINESIDISTIKLICAHYNVQVNTEDGKRTVKSKSDAYYIDDSREHLEKRAPVVAILGHVDHGKTSLLDKIRSSNVAADEAGGITQGLRAYNVTVPSDNKIVFLDTPGHEAFTQMRSRGALIMDIAILVVAADDSIRPQTLEAIQHIKEAKVPMIVAITKIDKQDANVEKIKEKIAEQGIIPEDWGGDTMIVPLSALTGENISVLLDSILLLADIQNLQSSSLGNGNGIIIEAQIDKNKGVAATVLVQQGTIHRGDIILADTIIGKIKIITDESNTTIATAGPSTIAKIWGFSEIPLVGSSFSIFNSEKEAKAQIKDQEIHIQLITKPFKSSTILDRSLKKELKVLNLVIKSNAQGALEAVIYMLKQIPQKKVALQVLSAGVGEITETDVAFASTTKALILGFDTTFAPGAKQAANRLNVFAHEYQVIYDLIENLEQKMCDLLDPEYNKNEIGFAVVKNTFPLAKGKVAGCYVESGKLVHNCSIAVVRENKTIYEGKLDSLKRVKDDVEEISSGNECGVLIKDFQDWEKNDSIQAFELSLKKISLT